MELTTIEFNQVIQKIFSHYELRSEWNSSTGSPKIKLIKNGFNEVPLESLSLGEQEMLSLVVSLNASRNRYDVFLIDEPEVHLNWHLEEKLFEYLDDFCELQEKQMIIVTHSRAIFQSRFLKKTQFLYWNSEGKISWGKTLTKEQSRRIAGEAIDIIKLGEFSKTTFFVEDYGQRYVIEALARVIEIDVSITECGNSSNVKSLFNYSKSEGGWANTFFLVDGDNQGNSLSSEKQFIQLDKYCIENYLLDFEIAAKITDKDETAIKQIILTCIKINASKILKKNKFFEFLVESLAEEHITPDRLELLDASEIMPAYLEKIGMAREDYINKYVIQCQSEGKLNLVFSPQLIEILNNTKVTSTDALKDHR